MPAAPGAGPIPADHPGIRDDIVRVGFLYLASAGTVAGAFGVEGYSQGDEVGEFRTLVADVNARGGLGGRQVEVVEHDVGGVDATAIERACARFTEDDPVYLVFAGIGHHPALDACLAEAGTGFVTSIVAPPQRLVDELRFIYAPDDISLERYAALLGRSLIDHGFFDGDAQAGLLHSDNPDDERAVQTILVPTLQAAGVDIVHTEVYSSTDAGNVVADAPGRVFRLRAAGVTHVIHFATPLYDMIAADAQGWQPAWAVTSRAGPGAFLEGSAPPGQLPRAAGPGWQPMSDLNAGRIPGPVSAEEERCDAVLRAAGYQLTGPPRVVAMMLCGALSYSQQALLRATEMTVEGYRVAAEGLGAQILSPVTHRLDFAGGRHDGAAAYRYITWDQACGCFGYSTDLQPTP